MVFRRIYLEATPFILVTTLAEIGAGSILLGNQDIVIMIPGLLFILPGLMTLRGSIASSLAQRLGSAIHIGLVSWQKGYNQIIRENVNASIVLSLIVSAVLSVLSWLWSTLIGLPVTSLFVLLLIAILTAGVSGVIQAFIAVLVAVYAAYKGLDPDNVTIPVLAALGDALTIFFLFLFVGLVVAVRGLIS